MKKNWKPNETQITQIFDWFKITPKKSTLLPYPMGGYITNRINSILDFSRSPLLLAIFIITTIASVIFEPSNDCSRP